ncbi:hypothetical protein ABK040_003213 [Willaertia magna]
MPSEPEKKTRYQKELEMIEQQIKEMDDKQGKLKLLFPKDYNTEIDPNSKYIKASGPENRFFTTLGTFIGFTATSYLLFPFINNQSRKIFKPFTNFHNIRYLFSIPVLSFFGIVVGGVLGGIYPFFAQKLTKYIKSDFNDSFDDFVMEDIPMTKNEIEAEISKN